MTKLFKKSLVFVMTAMLVLCAFMAVSVMSARADGTVISSTGASVRLADKTGIRFEATISEVKDDATYGFAIAPNYYLTDNDITENYIPELIDVYGQDGIIILKSTPVSNVIKGSVGNILDANYGLNYVGIPYELLNDVYTYGAVIESSILEISTKALNDYHYNAYEYETEELEIINGFMDKAVVANGIEKAISIDESKSLTNPAETAEIAVTTGLDKDLIVWSSDNTAVATVDNGVVTAIADGTANITAKIAGVEDTCAVTVSLPDTYAVSLDKAFANPGSDYTLKLHNANSNFFGKSGAQFTGSGSGTNSWKDNLFIDVSDYAGYDYLLVDMLIDTAKAAFFVNASTNNYVWAESGVVCDNGSFYSVIESDGAYYSVPFAYSQWITVAFKIADFNGRIDAIVSNNGTYISNMRAVKSSVVGEIQTTLPETLEVPNYTLGVYPGAPDWTLTSTYALETYEGKQAVKLVSGTAQDYKNRALIFTRQFAGYKWMLIDFYFNTGYAQFSDSTGNYNMLSDTLASTNGSFYAVREDNGEYVNVPGTRGQWITVAFRLESYPNFVDFIVGSNSSNYFANVRLVKSTVFDEPVEDESGDNSVLNVGMGAFVGTGVTLSTANGIGGRDGVISVAVNSGVAWHSSYAIMVITDYVALGYTTFSVDVYVNADFKSFYHDGSNLMSIALGSGCDKEGAQLLDGEGNPTTLTANTWVTLKFDLSIMTTTVIHLFRADTSTMYLSNACFEMPTNA